MEIKNWQEVLLREKAKPALECAGEYPLLNDRGHCNSKSRDDKMQL